MLRKSLNTITQSQNMKVGKSVILWQFLTVGNNFVGAPADGANGENKDNSATKPDDAAKPKEENGRIKGIPQTKLLILLFHL